MVTITAGSQLTPFEDLLNSVLEQRPNPTMTVGRTTNQSIPNLAVGGVTTRLISLEEFSGSNPGDGFFSLDGTNGYVTVLNEGFYRLGAKVTFDDNTTGYRVATMVCTNTNEVLSREYQSPNNGAPVGVSLNLVPRTYFLNANDVVQLGAGQSSGGALNVQGKPYCTFLELEYLGVSS